MVRILDNLQRKCYNKYNGKKVENHGHTTGNARLA